MMSGFIGQGCSQAHLPFHATNRAKNNVPRLLWPIIASEMQNSVLAVANSKYLSGERGLRTPLHLPLFCHPPTDSSFSPAPHSIRFPQLSAAGLSEYNDHVKTSRMGVHMPLQQYMQNLPKN